MINLFNITRRLSTKFISPIINYLIALQEKHYFKYFTYLGYLYIGRVLLTYIIDIKDYCLTSFSFKQFRRKYGKGWIIITEPNNYRLIDIINAFKDEGYKILIISKTNEWDKHTNDIEFDFYRKDCIITPEQFKDLSSKLNNVLLDEHVSMVIHNTSFRFNKYFDKLSDDDMRLAINANLISTIMILKFINERCYQSFRTLFVGFGDILADLKIPHMQLYSTYLTYSKILILRSGNIEKCYIEDGLTSGIVVPVYKLNNITEWGSEGIYLNYINKLMKDLTRNNYFLQFYYRYYLKLK
jgi:hypothetical protein